MAQDPFSLAIVVGLGILLLIGVLLVTTGLRRLIRGKLLSGSSLGLLGIAIGALVVSAALLGTSLHAYHRLVNEQHAVKLSFAATGPDSYTITLVFPEGDHQTVTLEGDEWQLDARIIKWTGPATLAGFHTLYRLERMSGRYRDIQREQLTPKSVVALSQEEGLIDAWSAIQSLSGSLPWLDAIYGSATFMPMGDGALYHVSVSTSGLVTRPGNDIARNLLNNW